MKYLSITFILFFCFAQTSQAQLLNKLKNKVSESSAKIKKGKMPITTSFSDVDKTKHIENNIGTGEDFLDLHSQPYQDSCFLLMPNFYRAEVASFCIKAGTYMPQKGSGRFYAPLKGSKADIVKTIALAYQNEKKISQQDAQLLFWAIIAKTDFTKMTGKVKVTALKVLSTDQILELSKGAATRLAKNKLKNLVGNSSPISSILDAENKLRTMYYDGVSTYEDFQDIAMLAGIDPIVEGFESGRWTKHPDGYYIRYFAHGYSKTVIEIYVPEETGEICYTGIGDVAVPANTASQRLLMTDLPKKNPTWKTNQDQEESDNN